MASPSQSEKGMRGSSAQFVADQAFQLAFLWEAVHGFFGEHQFSAHGDLEHTTGGRDQGQTGHLRKVLLQDLFCPPGSLRQEASRRAVLDADIHLLIRHLTPSLWWSRWTGRPLYYCNHHSGGSHPSGVISNRSSTAKWASYKTFANTFSGVRATSRYTRRVYRCLALGSSCCS